MKRLFALVLVLIMMATSLGVEASSVPGDGVNVDIGKVTEIIDGEVIKVYFYRRDFEAPSVETLRIIGIDSNASEEAFEYATMRLLGKSLYVVYDDEFQTMDGLDCAHIFADYEKSFAEELLERGYAVLDDSFEGARFYSDMVGAEYAAQVYQQGIWATSLSESSDRININTAKASILKEQLDLTTSEANDIIDYREDNPYNDIYEIMAADYDFDGEWMDENAHLISVVTNVNKASYLELQSLLPTYSGSDLVVDDLTHYLKFNEVEDLEDLEDISSFSGYYEDLETYLTVDATLVLIETDKDRVNINTVNEDDFEDITGLSSSAYEKLEDLRGDDGYVITALSELFIRDDLYSEALAYIYHDHMAAMTNVNTAGDEELESLFGQTDLARIERQDLADELMEGRPFANMSEVRQLLGSSLYSEIEPYIYVHSSDMVERYNLHTAEDEDLEALDEAYLGLYTEVTNINTATERMLMDLNEDMTEDLVEDILEYRSRYPFRDNDDLYYIFKDNDATILYNKIAYYLAYE